MQFIQHVAAISQLLCMQHIVALHLQCTNVQISITIGNALHELLHLRSSSVELMLIQLTSGCKTACVIIKKAPAKSDRAFNVDSGHCRHMALV